AMQSVTDRLSLIVGPKINSPTGACRTGALCAIFHDLWCRGFIDWNWFPRSTRFRLIRTITRGGRFLYPTVGLVAVAELFARRLHPMQFAACGAVCRRHVLCVGRTKGFGPHSRSAWPHTLRRQIWLAATVGRRAETHH